MFYGDWKRIRLAKSIDGKNFHRVLGGNGQANLFTEHAEARYTKGSNTRDPMVIKRGNTYYCYYSSHLEDTINDGWAFCQTSLNMKDWSESAIVSQPPYKTNSPRYSDECPHVIYLLGHKLYYLFVTQLYGQDSQEEDKTTVYASPNPMYFGIDDDSRKVCTIPYAAPEIILHEEQYYIAVLTAELDGIQLAKLKWE